MHFNKKNYTFFSRQFLTNQKSPWSKDPPDLPFFAPGDQN